MRHFADIVIAGALTAALACAAMTYRDDQAGRPAARRFVASFRLEERRPAVAKTLAYAPSADWTADILADAALRDAYESVDLRGLPAQSRTAWIGSMEHVDDELRAARSSLLDSIAVRPGWPFHQSLLGQVVFTIDSRDLAPELIAQSTTWSRPLLNACEAAPATAGLWQSLAAAYLSTWPELGSVHARTAPSVFRAAFLDPDFVRDAFGGAAILIGKEQAIGFLPRSAKPLRAAFDYFARQNDVEDAASVHRRWEEAEQVERAKDLVVIERHAARGDVDDVRSLCGVWLERHPARDFDSPLAQAQTARVLALWPGGRSGSWFTDPLADACRYLLTRSDDPARFGPVVGRVIENFDDVPLPVQAEVIVLAGDAAGGERVAQSAQETSSLQWAPFRLTLASSYLSSGHPEKAAAACEQLPPAATETHEALLVRSAIARARGDQPASAELLRRAAAGAISPMPACGTRSAIAVHGAFEPRTVRIRLTSTTPLLVDAGQNGARTMTIVVNGERIVNVTVRGWRDQTLSFKVASGTGDLCAGLI